MGELKLIANNRFTPQTPAAAVGILPRPKARSE